MEAEAKVGGLRNQICTLREENAMTLIDLIQLDSKVSGMNQRVANLSQATSQMQTALSLSRSENQT